MPMQKIALLMDVDNIKIDFESFKDVVNQVKNVGEIVYAKLYGFSDRKHRAFVDYVANEGYDTASTMRLKVRNKSQLDTRILIDAVQLSITNPSIDGFAIITGKGDIVPLISYLKSLGKYICGAFVGDEDSLSLCHMPIQIPSQAGFLTGGAAPNAKKPTPPKPKAKTPKPEVAKIAKVAVDDDDLFAPVFAESTPADDEQEEMLRTIERMKQEVNEVAEPISEPEEDIDAIMTMVQQMTEEATQEEEETLTTREMFLRNNAFATGGEGGDVFNISDYMVEKKDDELKTASFDIDDGNLKQSLENIKSMMENFEKK